MRTHIFAAVLTFVGLIGLSDLVNHGHGYINLLIVTAVFLLCLRLEARGWRRLFQILLGVSVAMTALCLAQRFYVSRPQGVFSSPNYLAGYAVLHVFLSLYWRKADKESYLALVALGANVLTAIAAGSRGGFIALAFGLLFMHRRERGVVAAAGLFAAFAAITTYTRMYGVEEPRIGLWWLGLRLAEHRLILGWGENGVSVSGLTHFYSAGIDWLLWGGVPALCAGIWLFVEALRAAYKAEKAALVAFLVAWLVNTAFIPDTAAVDLPLFVVLAYLASKRRDVADGARRVDDGQPLLDGRVRARRP